MDPRMKINVVTLLAKGDDQYYALLKELRAMEKEYHRVLATLPYDVQDIICDYISKNEEISWRILEIACQHMEFPKE